MTVVINNYDPSYAYLVSSNRGTIVKSLPVGTFMTLTVTNAAANTTVTVQTLRQDTVAGTASITG